jgi:hypothetical protein
MEHVLGLFILSSDLKLLAGNCVLPIFKKNNLIIRNPASKLD